MEVAAARPAVLKDGAAPAGGTGSGRWRWIVLGVLVALVAALLVVGVPLVGKKWAASGEAEQRDAVLASARQVSLNMVSMSYKSVNDDIARVLSGSTGSFKDEFAGYAQTMKDQVTKNQGTSQGEVLSAGVTSMDDDSAEAIVAVSSTVTSPAVPTGTPRNMRFRFDLVKVKGKWLVSKFGLVQ